MNEQQRMRNEQFRKQSKERSNYIYAIEGTEENEKCIKKTKHITLKTKLWGLYNTCI